MQKKRVVTVGVSGIALLLLVIFGLRFVRSRDSGKISKTRSTVTESTVSNKESERELETGDGFNTDDLDTGVVKESKAQGGLAHRADEEAAASSESSVQETYAETDADGKNLTEPAQIANSDASDLSEKAQKKVTEEQQNAYDVKYGMVLYGYNRAVGCLVILLFLFILWESFVALFKIIREYKDRLILLAIILLICISLELFSKLGILPMLFSTIIMGALLKDCSDYIFNIKKIKERTAYERSKGNGFNEDYFNLVVNHYMLALKLIVPSSVISFAIDLKLLELPFFKKMDTVDHYGTEIISLLIGMFVGLGLYCFIKDKDVDKLINRRGWNFHPYTPEEKKVIVGIPVESHCSQSNCKSSDENETEVIVDKKEMKGSDSSHSES
ncbi:hypothetical protein [Stomatobaculum longum]|uniref:hypothetical protein n=1 Tax=Stomatobaculum longum TaxID=796942 RepID=UPI0028E8A808|nr:hypothetical protein [Stomatobaculum longum]